MTGSSLRSSFMITSTPSSSSGRVSVGIEAEHDGVRGQRAWPEAEHEPAAGEVVEQHGALGDHVGVVVRHAGDAGAELDVARALGRGGDEDLRAGDDLVPAEWCSPIHASS